MAKIAGVDIPDNKRGEISLTYVFGVGKSSAQVILDQASVDKNTKVQDWSDDETKKIRDLISEGFTVEGELRSEVQLYIKRLMDIRSYRGIRHRAGLPLRGQHTKNNSRTRKGKEKLLQMRRRLLNNFS